MQLIGEINDSTGLLTKSYTSDPRAEGGVGGLLAITTYDTYGNVIGVYIPTFNAHGDVTGLINKATGTVVANYTYSAFGERADSGVGAEICPFGWQTQYHDPGVIHFYARAYLPQLGRFLQRDPVGLQGGENEYVYGKNDPINTVDPLGFSGEEIGLGSVLSYAWNHTGEMIGYNMRGWGHIFSGHLERFEEDAEALRSAIETNYDSTGGQGELSVFGHTTIAGVSTVANTLTFEQFATLQNWEDQSWNAIGMKDSGWHTGSKVFAGIAREALVTAATMGAGAYARTCVAAPSMWTAMAQGAARGFSAAMAGRDIYQGGQSIISGASRVYNGDNWGYLEMLGGAISVAGGVAGVKGAFGAAKCFIAGTQVVIGVAEGRAGEGEEGESSAAFGGATATATLRYLTQNIESLRAGDTVLTRDEFNAAAPMVHKRIEEVFVRTAYDLLLVTLRSSTGLEQTLHTTSEHPVYVPEVGWVKAADLEVGQELVEPDGSTTIVVGIKWQAYPLGVEVYNFRVADEHTYFVRAEGSTAEPVWVHNSYRGDALLSEG